MSSQKNQSLISILKPYKGEQGLYIIRSKSNSLLADICKKLDYNLRSDIAYVGKASKTKSSSLYVRAKQEMGWSNFEGATFMRKIAIYLGVDVKDKKNKILRDQVRSFICENFEIECIVLDNTIDVLQKETEFIATLKPCLNDKKVIPN